MPLYIYGCDQDKDHARIEKAHGMMEDPEVLCSCGARMHRVPQAAEHFVGGVLLDWMNHNYNRYRAGKPRFSPYKVMRPGGMPGKDFHTR